MSRSQCPTADKLETFATAPMQYPQISEHVASCPRCKKIVEDFRDENSVVRTLQNLSESKLKPAIQRRLVSRSRDAVFHSDQAAEDGVN